jgi:hypothetical protein
MLLDGPHKKEKDIIRRISEKHLPSHPACSFPIKYNYFIFARHNAAAGVNLVIT